MNNEIVTHKPVSLIAKFAGKYGVESEKMLTTLKATAFKVKNGEPVTNEQMMALLIVADQYGLNPFTKEIYAYPDKGGIVPVVGVDGWSRIMNEHPDMDGIEFRYSEETVQHKGKTCHVWVEAIIYRKGRSHPVVVRERFEEVLKTANFPTPWDTHPSRMHRHKALIQCARVAFGFTGIVDEDEASRIFERDITDVATATTAPIKQPTRKSERQTDTETIDAETGEIINEQRKVIEERLNAKQDVKPVYGDKSSEPLPASQISLINAKLEAAGLSGIDVHKKFGKDVAELTKADWNAVMSYISNPMGE